MSREMRKLPNCVNPSLAIRGSGGDGGVVVVFAAAAAAAAAAVTASAMLGTFCSEWCPCDITSSMLC